MIILGIDPGSRIIGYGFIEKNNGDIKHLSHGCIQLKEIETSLRLVKLKRELEKLIKKHRPQKAAVEKIFFFKNQKTAIEVAQSRGVILFILAQNNIDIYEFTPLQVKQSVTAYGRADKFGVQKMVKIILNLKETPEPNDAADALAIAICAANNTLT